MHGLHSPSLPACLPEIRPPTNRPEAGRPEAGRPEAGRPEAGRQAGHQPTRGRPEAGRPPTRGRPPTNRPEAGRPEAGRPEAGHLKTKKDYCIAFRVCASIKVKLDPFFEIPFPAVPILQWEPFSRSILASLECTYIAFRSAACQHRISHV
jgi:hypothetical protein